MAANAFRAVMGSPESGDAAGADQPVASRQGEKSGQAQPSEEATEGAAEKSAEAGAGEKKRAAAGAMGSASELSADDLAQVKDLKARDQKVRAHEQAHQSAGGQYAGSAQFSFAVGPDGKRYAVSGEVSIDVSMVPDNPQATIAKMEVVKRAAVAPAEPSAADRMVYSTASRIEQNAQGELIVQRAQEASGGDESEDSVEETSADTEQDSTDSEASSRVEGSRAQREGAQSGSFSGVYA